MTDAEKEAHALLHDCERNARYHTARRSFLDRGHRVMSMTAVLLAGSAAVAAISEAFKAESIVPILLMLVPTFVGAITLVWNPAGRARDHQILASRFYQIAREISLEPADTERVKQWQADILNVLEDEPPTIYFALNSACYNEASRAMYRQPQRFYPLRRHQRLLRNWWPFSPGTFKLVDP